MIVNNRFWRLEPDPSTDPTTIIGSPALRAPAQMIAKLRRLDGIVLATWDPDTQQGRVHALGIVQNVDSHGSAVVHWRPTSFSLHPSASGSTQWKTRPYFKFNDLVAERYRLIDHFRSAFATDGRDINDPPGPEDEGSGIPAIVPRLPDDHPMEVATSVPDAPVAQCNRVAPNGEIFADPARGLFMGNRTSPPRWLVCDLHFKRDLKEPRKYTKLFFLDEAVALAAGHRPCNTCRRDRYTAYLAAVKNEINVHGSAELDAQLSTARGAVGARTLLASLPDGAYVALRDGDFRLKWSGALHRWTPAGYVDPVALKDLEVDHAAVLTPEPSLIALRNGYSAEIHPSAL